jgi:integrase
MLDEAAEKAADKAAEKAAKEVIKQLHLENRIVPKHMFDALMEEETMKRIKQRVIIGDETRWVTGNNQQDVFEKANILLSGHEESKSKGICFDEYTEKWFSLYKENTLKPTTKVGYRSYLKTHLYPAFGHISLSAITTDMIQAFMNERSDMAAKSLRSILSFLATILEAALEDGYINRNPAKSKRLVIPSTKVTVREPLSNADFTDIIRSINSLQKRDQLFVSVLLFTGIRRGELIGLMWQDIDLEKGLISVERSATYPSTNQAVISTPKTRSGIRLVPIIEQLLPYICETGQSDCFVIGGDMKPISLQQYRNIMSRVKKTIDLHYATAHLLRHTMITSSYYAGVNPKTLQKVAGHSKYTFTLDRYVHTPVEEISRAGIQFSEHLNSM